MSKRLSEKSISIIAACMVLTAFLMSGVNPDIMMMNDDLRTAIDTFVKSDSKCVYNNWDIGNVIFGYTDKIVQCRSVPRDCFEEFASLLVSEEYDPMITQNTECVKHTLIITSYDLTRLATYEKLLKRNVTANSFVWNLTGMQNMTEYKLVQFSGNSGGKVWVWQN
jgi:hypothetical protein